MCVRGLTLFNLTPLPASKPAQKRKGKREETDHTSCCLFLDCFGRVCWRHGFLLFHQPSPKHSHTTMQSSDPSLRTNSSRGSSRHSHRCVGTHTHTPVHACTHHTTCVSLSLSLLFLFSSLSLIFSSLLIRLISSPLSTPLSHPLSTPFSLSRVSSLPLSACLISVPTLVFG